MPRFGCLTVFAALVVGFVAGVLLVVVLAWTSNAAPPEAQASRPTVPRVVGLRLDHADARLERAGYRVEHESDGLFGVVVARNWRVRAQRPGPAAALAPGSTVRLVVRHS